MLMLKNELGNIPSFFNSLEQFNITDVISFLSVRKNLPVKPSGPECVCVCGCLCEGFKSWIQFLHEIQYYSELLFLLV